MHRRRFLGLLAGAGAMALTPVRNAFAAPDLPAPGLAKGMVTFTFDDGIASVYQYALPVLRGRNQVATAGLIASRLIATGNDDYMSVDQAKELAKAGWEIASHSLTHTRPISIPKYYSQEPVSGWSVDAHNPKTYQTQYDYDIIAGIYQDGKQLAEVEKLEHLNLTPGTYYYDRAIAELHVHPWRGGPPEDLDIRAGSYQRELEQSHQILSDQGFKISTYVAPYNYWPDDMKETSRYYYSQACTGKDSDNRVASFDPYAIRRFMVHEKDSPTALIRLLQENALTHGGWVIFCFHGVGDSIGWEPYSVEKLDALSAWVAQQGIPMVTVEQGARIMREAAKTPARVSKNVVPAMKKRS